MLPLIYHASYSKLALPSKHRFPATKYLYLYQYLLQQGIAKQSQFFAAEQVTPKALAKTHCADYVSRFINGTLDTKSIRRIGFPWSESLVARTLHSVAGTQLACLKALEYGCAIHLSGGYHHAHHRFGSGFCIFNDLTYAAQQALKQPGIDNVLIFDCDVHQGDGTATTASAFDKIITCSIHCQHNFPARKQQSNYDIELPRGTTDKYYLETVSQTLSYLIRLHQPDLIIYDAGVDIHTDDNLGYFNISTEGIFARDKVVIQQAYSAKIPIACVIGGGYSNEQHQLNIRHSQLFLAANTVFGNDLNK